MISDKDVAEAMERFSDSLWNDSGDDETLSGLGKATARARRTSRTVVSKSSADIADYGTRSITNRRRWTGDIPVLLLRMAIGEVMGLLRSRWATAG